MTSINRRRMFEMLLLGGLGLLGGCVETHYHYQVSVPGVTPQSPATVEIRSYQETRTYSLSSDAGASVKLTDIQQFPGSVFAMTPAGFHVKVSRDGYKTWETSYRHGDEQFWAPRWDELYRQDVVRLEPAASTQPSAQVGGTPLYR